MLLALLIALFGIAQLYYLKHEVSDDLKYKVGFATTLFALFPLLAQATIYLSTLGDSNSFFLNVIHQTALSFFGELGKEGLITVPLNVGFFTFYVDLYRSYRSLLKPIPHIRGSTLWNIVPMILNLVLNPIKSLIALLLLSICFLVTFVPILIVWVTLPCDPFSGALKVRPGLKFEISKSHRLMDWSNNPFRIQETEKSSFLIRNSRILLKRHEDRLEVSFGHKDKKCFYLCELRNIDNLNFLRLSNVLEFMEKHDVFFTDGTRFLWNDMEIKHCLKIKDVIKCVEEGKFEVKTSDNKDVYSGYMSPMIIEDQDWDLLKRLTFEYFGEFNFDIISSVLDNHLFYRAKPDNVGNYAWKRFVSDVSRHLRKKYGMVWTCFTLYPVSQKFLKVCEELTSAPAIAEPVSKSEDESKLCDLVSLPMIEDQKIEGSRLHIKPIENEQIVKVELKVNEVSLSEVYEQKFHTGERLIPPLMRVDYLNALKKDYPERAAEFRKTPKERDGPEFPAYKKYIDSRLSKSLKRSMEAKEKGSYEKRMYSLAKRATIEYNEKSGITLKTEVVNKYTGMEMVSINREREAEHIKKQLDGKWKLVGSSFDDYKGRLMEGKSKRECKTLAGEFIVKTATVNSNRTQNGKNSVMYETSNRFEVLNNIDKIIGGELIDSNFERLATIQKMIFHKKDVIRQEVHEKVRESDEAGKKGEGSEVGMGCLKMGNRTTSGKSEDCKSLTKGAGEGGLQHYNDIANIYYSAVRRLMEVNEGVPFNINTKWLMRATNAYGQKFYKTKLSLRLLRNFMYYLNKKAGVKSTLEFDNKSHMLKLKKMCRTTLNNASKKEKFVKLKHRGPDYKERKHSEIDKIRKLGNLKRNIDGLKGSMGIF